MTALIRKTSLAGFQELVGHLGGNADALLQRFRVFPQMLQEEEARLPLRSLVGAMELAAQTLKCPDFGLRMAEYQDMHVLGPVAVIARSSSTVRQALESISRFISYHSPGVYIELDCSEPESPRLVVDIRLANLTRRRQTSEMALGMVYNTVKLLCGKQFSPQSVLLTGIPPLPLERYRHYFQSAVYAGHAHNALVLRREHLNQPIERQDPMLHRVLLEYLQAFEMQPRSDILHQVHSLVQRMLPTQRCRLSLVAEQLGLHERALQRRLAERGYYFEDLVERIRRELAKIYLAERGMPMSQVANLLGYSEQSVFSRACRRWFAQTPSAMRRQLLANSKENVL
ncbi:AraC family transcriptional regulator [Pseudomonas sp. NPDC090755]|uniref:AraC family transcriptional regulator n=1 Tax=Pseudomonas sp. NPDC090755 TaxID=3364481 RepID=UPI00383A3341